MLLDIKSIGENETVDGFYKMLEYKIGDNRRIRKVIINGRQVKRLPGKIAEYLTTSINDVHVIIS